MGVLGTVAAAQCRNEPDHFTTPLKPDALGVDVAPRLRTLKVEEPPRRKAGTKVPDAKTLVQKLKNEAKVIS